MLTYSYLWIEKLAVTDAKYYLMVLPYNNENECRQRIAKSFNVTAQHSVCYIGISYISFPSQIAHRLSLRSQAVANEN